MKQLICEMCGCTDLKKEENKYICTACGTEFINEDNQISKEDITIYDFTCDDKACMLSVKEWLIDNDYCHDDILIKAKFNTLEKNYIPFYFITGQYSANWTADSGYKREEIYTVYEKRNVQINGKYQTVTEPVTKKRTVTDWHPSTGTASGKFGEFVVAGDFFAKESFYKFWETSIHITDGGINLSDFDKTVKNIYPYKLNDSQALEKAKPRINEKIQANVRDNIPGDCVDNIKWNADMTYDYYKFYYPLFMGSFEYNNITYPYIVDGRNVDRLFGTRPNDTEKIERIRSQVNPLKKFTLICNAIFVITMIILFYTDLFEASALIVPNILLIAFASKFYSKCLNEIEEFSLISIAKRMKMLRVLRDENISDTDKNSRLNSIINSNINLTEQEKSKLQNEKSLDSETIRINSEVKSSALTYFILSILMPSIFLLIRLLIMIF